MSKNSNKTRRKKINQLRPFMEREQEGMETKMKEMDDKAFEFREEAKKYKLEGNVPKALDAMKKSLFYQKQAEQYLQRISRIMNHRSKLNTINHKLVLRSFPNTVTRTLVNTHPTIHANNNSLEQFYSKRYMLNNEDENENENVESKGCLRDMFGRCIEGLKARFTKKNKNKKAGGGKKKRTPMTRKTRKN